MAVRATSLIHEAHHAGLLPPEIQPCEISGESRKPSLSELNAIEDLQHLVRCVEVRYSHATLPDDWIIHEDGDYGRWPLDRLPPPPENTPKEPAVMSVWRERFHAATYTSLLMGALFSRAYNEPFHPSAVLSNDRTARRAHRRLLYGMSKAQFWFSKDELEYLSRFPVFDLNDELGQHKETFGGFVDWFMHSAILQHRAGPPPPSRDLTRPGVDAATAWWESQLSGRSPPGTAWMDWPETGRFCQWFKGGSPGEGEAILWQLMQSIHMFEFMLTCITNSDSKRRLGRLASKDPVALPSKTRSAKVVLFGVFQAEEITMPDDVANAASRELLAHTPRPSGIAAPLDKANEYLAASPPILDIPLALEDLYKDSGIANTIDNRFDAPPPPLQLFCFALRHHFNLQYYNHAFSTFDGRYQDYYLFKNRATIFANGPEHAPGREWFDYTNGSEFLVEYRPPSDLTYWTREDQMYGHINPRAYLPWELMDTPWSSLSEWRGEHGYFFSALSSS